MNQFPYFPSIFHESKHHFPSILWGSIISKPVRHVGPESFSLRPNPSVLFCAGAEWRDEWMKIDMGIPQNEAARLQGFAHICNLEIDWKSFLHRDIFLRWGGEGHSILRHPLNGNCQVPRRFLLLAVATLALMIEVERSCQCEDCWKLRRRDLRSILWYSMELPWRRNICRLRLVSICQYVKSATFFFFLDVLQTLRVSEGIFHPMLRLSDVSAFSTLQCTGTTCGTLRGEIQSLIWISW